MKKPFLLLVYLLGVLGTFPLAATAARSATVGLAAALAWPAHAPVLGLYVLLDR